MTQAVVVMQEDTIARFIANNENHQVPDTLDHVKDFTLMWSYTEGKIIETHRDGNGSLGCNIFNQIITPENATLNGYIDEAYQFFQERYLADNFGEKFNDLFNGRDEDAQIVTQRTLMENGASDLNKVKSLAFICSRIRNNLFHGSKKFREIVNEPEVIENATTGIRGLAIALTDAHDPE